MTKAKAICNCTGVDGGVDDDDDDDEHEGEWKREVFLSYKSCFICVSALVLSTARVNFLNVLCYVVSDCADD